MSCATHSQIGNILPDRPHQQLSGENLRNKARAANLLFGRETARVRSEDTRFDAIYEMAMSLQAEINLRKNT